MSRLSFGRLLAVLVIGLAVPSHVAAGSPQRLSGTLDALWTKVLGLPVDQNPFTGGDPCLMLDSSPVRQPVLAPFAQPTPTTTCSATLGTKLFVTGWSSECSNIEDPPFHGDGEAALRACARAADAGLNTPVVTFDGRRVRMTEVETPLMDVTLPEGNIFKQDAGTLIESVGHGWVAMLPLAPGSHTVVIHTTGTYVQPPGPLDVTTTTTIIVTR
jgi:hypothetical protein